ncbi:unnamed protein product [Trifolium pratense]|uniref:Uncharacterized protein n=1 Tax=Trifolium pratense TaxID=57577 RepID=A0ACB0KK34_TRIPR|nr:unnamed protein product [Trifolium pratense]
MQKAWFYEEYGPKEVLKLGDLPIPSPLHNQLLVQVHAAALNPIDSKRRLRPIFPSEFPVVPGCDMAGVVIGKGINVKKFEIGDEVYGNIQDFNNTDENPKQLGTLAQFIVVEEKLVARKPKCLSFEEAASLPLAVQTAIEGFKTGDFKKGDCKKSIVVAKKDGAIVDITWPPSHPRAVYSSLSVSGEILENLRPYLERGELKAVIDPKGEYDFENVIEAFGYIETGRAWGKVVVSCFPNNNMENHHSSNILSEIDNNIQHVSGNLAKDLYCLK